MSWPKRTTLVYKQRRSGFHHMSCSFQPPIRTCTYSCTHAVPGASAAPAHMTTAPEPGPGAAPPREALWGRGAAARRDAVTQGQQHSSALLLRKAIRAQICFFRWSLKFRFSRWSTCLQTRFTWQMQILVIKQNAFKFAIYFFSAKDLNIMWL